MTRLVFITSKASRSRISSRAFADYVEEDASMPNQLASTPWTSSIGSGTVSEADEKGGPSKGGEESERANDFFRFASDLTYPRSVHVRADGPFEPNCFASPTYEGTRARQNALISSLFVPRHRPQRWTSNVMVTTGETSGKGAESVLSPWRRR